MKQDMMVLKTFMANDVYFVEEKAEDGEQSDSALSTFNGYMDRFTTMSYNTI